MLSLYVIPLHLRNITLGKAWSWLGTCAPASHSTAVHTCCGADFHGVINLIDFLEIAPVGGIKPALMTFAKFGLWFLAELSRLGAHWGCLDEVSRQWVTNSSLSLRHAHSQLWDVGCEAEKWLQTAAAEIRDFQECWVAACPCWGLGFGSL